MYLDMVGLTSAQSRVVSVVLQGRSTQQIVNELCGIGSSTRVGLTALWR
jgi:hypothetical protein